jgi:hypothetical protein
MFSYRKFLVEARLTQSLLLCLVDLTHFVALLVCISDFSYVCVCMDVRLHLCVCRCDSAYMYSVYDFNNK